MLCPGHTDSATNKDSGINRHSLINAGVNAARQATISAVTAAITGGDPARAALGGLVSGTAGVIPYVGTIVGGGAAAELQGGKFGYGAIGGAFDTGVSSGLAWLARSGNLQAAVDIQDPITITVGSRSVGILARHLFIEIPREGRWEMGPSGQGKWTSTTRANDRASFSTAFHTQAAIDAGRVTWRAMVVSQSGLNRGIANFDMTYVGQRYNALSHNSNFAVRYVLREAGGGNIPTFGSLGFAPGFPDMTDGE